MKEFVYGARNGISIIDLTKTMHQLANACNFLGNVVAKGGDILFVGTKRQAQEVIRSLAAETGMYYVAERWMGGMLTNNITIRKSIAKMVESDKLLADEEATSKLKKKEVVMMTRDNQKLHSNLDGIAEMKKLPAAMFVIDVCHNDIAVREAAKLNIPIVAICDTNADPDLIDYPIVANDDAVKSLQVITDVVRDAILTAKEVYNKSVVEAATAKGAAEKIADEAAADAEAAAPKKRAPRKADDAKKRAPRKAAAKEEAAEAKAE
jgi:small subunit ribosomal protein S2